MGTEVEVLIRAKDLASKTFKSIGANFSMISAPALKVAKAVGKIALAAAAASAAVLLLSAKMGKDFQFSIKSVGVVAGATEAELKQLEKTARAIGGTTAFSAKEAADAMYNLASAGLEVSQVMGSAENAVKLAGATASDMATSTSLMASTLKVFNLDASESAHISDVFAGAVSNSMFTLQGLTDAMKFAAPIGAALGMSLEQTTSAVAQFKDLGLEASQSGTAFRMAMISILKPTDQVHESLRRLGVDWAEINPEAKNFDEIIARLAQTNLSAADAVQIFGSRAGGAMAQIVNQARTGQVVTGEFTKALVENVGTASDMYAEMMDTVQGQWKILTSAASESMLRIFDMYADVLQSMLTATSNFVTSVNEGLAGIAPTVQASLAFIVEMAKGTIEAFRNVTSGISQTKTTTAEAGIAILTFMRGTTEVLVKVFEVTADMIAHSVEVMTWSLGRLMKSLALMGKIPGLGALGQKLQDISDSLFVVSEKAKTAQTKIGEFSGMLLQSAESATTAAIKTLAAGEAMKRATTEIAEVGKANFQALNVAAIETANVLVDDMSNAIIEDIPIMESALQEMGDRANEAWNESSEQLINSAGQTARGMAAAMSQGGAARVQGELPTSIQVGEGISFGDLLPGRRAFTARHVTRGTSVRAFDEGGTPAQDMLGLLHKGEKVIPLDKQDSGKSINVNITWNTTSIPSESDTRRMVRNMLTVFNEEVRRRGGSLGLV